MKKLTSLLLSMVLMVSVLACGASAKTSTKVRIAGLKGPTTMGLVNLLSMEKDGTASLDYDLQLYGAADEIVPKLIKGELDMAAIPANLAATLYQKTNGGIQVMAVNTLGVLYVVERAIPSTALPTSRAAHPFHRQRHDPRVRPALSAQEERPRPRQGREDRILQRGFRGHGPDGRCQKGCHRRPASALRHRCPDEGQRPPRRPRPDQGMEQGL